VKIFGLDIRREQKAAQFETVLQRLIAAQEGRLGGGVTPDNCEHSPTVKSIVTAVANRLAVTPVHLYRKRTVAGRESKEHLPNHPVATLLEWPNKYQSRADFWSDAASNYVRHGNFVCRKMRGTTGPIRFLEPLVTRGVSAEKDGIEARLELYALNQRGEPLADAKREGRKVTLHGKRYSLPVIFTSDLLIKSFKEGSPKHKELLAILSAPSVSSVTSEEMAEQQLRLFFDPPNTWTVKQEDGQKFRAAAAEMLPEDIAPKFIAACTAKGSISGVRLFQPPGNRLVSTGASLKPALRMSTEV
jgi:hypothetical protein